MELFSLTQSEVGLTSSKSTKRKRVIVELQKLFALMQSPQYSHDSFALSTKSLTTSFGWKADEAMDQHDINELYNLLLDGIERQMPSNKQILNKYYKGRIMNVIKCTECEYDSQRKEDFVQLNVILQTMNSSFDSLHESLISNYIDNEEILENENAYFCPQCDKKVSAKKFCRLIKLPSIMVCNLNRFYFDLKSGERIKINKKFKFPKSLDLSMFIQNEYTEMSDADLSQYDLIGIVVHRGSGANAGHYHAFIRDMNNEVEWKPLVRKKANKKRRRQRRKNQNNNRNRNKEKERKIREKKEEAIAILVSILSENEQLTRNRLSAEFKRMTSFAGWDYEYSNLLGSFTNFLKNNHRFRIIDTGNRVFSVCLASDRDRNGNLNGFVVSDGDDDGDDGGDGGDEEYKPISLINDGDNSNSNGDDMKYDSCAPHWFDFNDEDITAVFDSDIDHLYDGGDDECPYMVIYRRKCMNTGHWPPEIPAFVSSLLIDEPLDAEEDAEQMSIAIIKLSIATKLVCDGNSKEEMDVDLSQMNISQMETEIIIISDDDETPEKLICVSPSKKRKFEEISSSETNDGDEPHKKKRKTGSTSLAQLPHQNTNRKTKRKRKTKTKEYIKSEYLEAIQVMRGNTLSELYDVVSEWSGIERKDLEIAQILCKGRNYAKSARVVNLSSSDANVRLKHVPLSNCSQILVWNRLSYGGDLAEKELVRRKECIALSVYILSRSLPVAVYINTSCDTLSDLYCVIRSQLNEEECDGIEECGRFRDIDTHSIYRDLDSTLCSLGISDGNILKFENKRMPKSSEIVIRYRLKTGQVSAKDCDEKELYISGSEDVSHLFAMMTSAFNVNANEFYLRKGRSDWAQSSYIDTECGGAVVECGFESETQRLILAENNVNKNMRNVDIYCEIQIVNGIKTFRIAKHLLEEIETQTQTEIETETETIVLHDGLDVYECNSSILCSLNIDRRMNGLEIKKEILKREIFNLNTKLARNISPLHLRISILTRTGSRTKWHILNEWKKIGGCNGKCIVEFLNSPQKDNDYGNKASGKALIFVHKLIRNENENGDICGAVYGSRYDICVTHHQREKLEALKHAIIEKCDFDCNTKTSHIVLATRNVANHRWSLLTNNKRMTIAQRIYDRDIVAVLNTQNSKQLQPHPHIFETKYDKYCAKKYEKEIKIKFSDDDDDDGDEPELKINFVNLE